jgi:MFS family permease
MILWGIGMGAQESVMKAEVSEIIPTERRGTAFGTFNALYGLFWFAGSALMGYLYDVSFFGLIIFSVITQFIAAIIIFSLAGKRLSMSH